MSPDENRCCGWKDFSDNFCPFSVSEIRRKDCGGRMSKDFGWNGNNPTRKHFCRRNFGSAVPAKLGSDQPSFEIFRNRLGTARCRRQNLDSFLDPDDRNRIGKTDPRDDDSYSDRSDRNPEGSGSIRRPD